MKMRSGKVLVTARNTAVRTPDLTPMRLIAVSRSRGSTMARIFPVPTLAAGQR